MTKRPRKGKGKSHPETTNDRPGDNPQAAKEEARQLRPNPETRSGDGDSGENILESEFESTNERDLESQAPKSPPLTEPADNAKVDRVIPDEEPRTGAVAALPQERAYLVSPRLLRNLFIASNVAAVSLIVTILTLASSAPQGRYTPADETQYQRTLVEATDAISTTAPNDGGDTARIPIADAIALVAEQGVTQVTTTLAEAPATAATGEAPVEAIPTPAAPPPAPDTEGAPIPQGADPATEGAAPAAAAAPAEAAIPPPAATPPAATPAGEATAEAPPAEPAAAPAATPIVDTAAGEAVFVANCSSCHQATGQGIAGAFPSLVGHVPLLYNADRAYLINLQLYGLQGEIEVLGETYNGVMPAWTQLSDDDIANVLNYVSTAWGNEAQLQGFQPYTAADVAPLRDAGLTSQDVYTLRQELALGE